MELTVSQAAHRLGVSPQAVRMRIAAGHLIPTGGVGRMALLDDRIVEAVRRTSQRGRLWSEDTAWAALELLADGVTGKVTGTQRSRLKARLRQMSTEAFAHAATGRGRLLRLTAHEGTSSELRRRLTLTGPSSLTDAGLAEGFSLTAGNSEMVYGYATEHEWTQLERDFLMELSSDGVLLLRITKADAVINHATVALDLYELGSERESLAGARWLDQALRHA